jgi:hypothetical protein
MTHGDYENSTAGAVLGFDWKSPPLALACMHNLTTAPGFAIK